MKIEFIFLIYYLTHYFSDIRNNLQHPSLHSPFEK
jgi:hypothetical protein